MKPIQDKYPHFEANQVLTNSHLNQVFDYLDEQERLTRANLIGIGIVCGLDFRTETTNGSITIHVSRGTGVGSAGYLLTEPDNIALVSYRDYFLPNEISYPRFRFDDGGILKQYPMWELFPAGEPDTTALNTPQNFLNDKVLVLFLELRMEGLRNCSPNDCNDKGEAVTVTLRHLLIRITDMEKIIAAGNQLQGNLTLSDLENSLFSRLNLPDIRLPRWDVPNTSPITSQEVLQGFHSVFMTDKIADKTGQAISEAYQAFKPLLLQDYPSDPFSGFSQKFGFLDNTQIAVNQLKFIQYYYGFFEDLLNAYDEFRWKGIRLLCACCPPEDLFPRHLMLGVIYPASVNNPEIFRNRFITSPAISNCEDQIKELRQLFMRLVEMTLQFTDTPPLPQSNDDKRRFRQIRITPDKFADISLSEKAIPYYYLQNAPPYLYRLWNYSRTRSGRANQNQAYRADEYVPAAPDFILNPLCYDLEPYNFFRIEGHLGLNYQAVLSRLLSVKQQNRLPIDIIALRTGIFDEKLLASADEHACHFSDLEALYDSRIGELIGFLGGNLKYFYDLFFPQAKGLLLNPVPSQVQWFAEYDPDFRVKPNTLGAYFEVLIWPNVHLKPYISPDNPALNLIDFIGNTNEPLKELIIIYVIYYIARFPEILSQNLPDLELDTLIEREKHLTRVAEAVEIKREQLFNNDQNREGITSWEDLDDRLEAIVYGHYSDSIKALIKEYHLRLREITKRLFLSNYLKNNPGIQHKAGVVTGGTFILVYHGETISNNDNTNPRFGNFVIRGQVVLQQNEPLPGVAVMIKGTSTGALTDMSGNFVLRTKQLPITIRIAPAGFKAYEKFINEEGFFLLNILDESSGDNQQSNSAFFPGEVIADFYLPYLCNSDCAPVQFVLPVVPPSFTVETGCTGDDGNTIIILTPSGGTAPYRLKINEGNFTNLNSPFTLAPGEYIMVIQDSEGVLSAPQTIVVPAALTLGQPNFDCTGDNNRFVAVIEISGGIPPYSSNIGRILNEKTFFAEDLQGNTDIEIIITDSRKCSASMVINHSCGPELAFNVRIGCSNADNHAPVDIIASGGVAPYEVQIDDGSFEPVSGPVHLPAGVHTLVVRDSSGALSSPLEIEIPGRIDTGEPNFDCVGTNNQYIAVMEISGGTPPYVANRGNFQGSTYISDPLTGGTDTEIVIFDSRKCSVSRILNHTCTGILSFRVNIGCTSANGVAMVEIIPSGGIAPYEIQTGTSPFEPLTGPVSLTPGTIQLSLRDSAQTVVSQSITIPDALVLTILKLSCDENNKNYQASIGISGGTPPYIANGNQLTGNVFVTEPIPGGQTATVLVFDSAKCSSQIEVQHSCDEPCNLPCNGETMQCAYRLWLQPPTKTEFYEVYQTLKEINFRFNGKNINIADSVQLLQISTSQLNNNFNNAITDTIKKLNEAINQALVDSLGDEGNNRLNIIYDPQATDPFAVMRIEHFVCDTFSIEFIYRFGKPSPLFNLTVRYSNEPDEAGLQFNGAVFVNHDLNNKLSVVPAFDCSQRNLCSDGIFEKLCKDFNIKPDFTIRAIRTAVNLASTTPGNIKAWIWDISGSIAGEPFYTGERVATQIAGNSAVIRLTVISPEGCFSFTDKEFNR